MGDNVSYQTPTPAARRVAAYCRVSTLAEEQALSFETQCAYYARLIDDDPTMMLAGVYGDRGGSGLTVKKRPAFQRMMEDCLDGKIDLVLTKSVSRFARNLSDCVRCVRLLREKGVPVLFEKEGIDSADPGGELILSVLASLAQQEVHAMSESVRWSFDCRNAGGQPARAARYGYRRDGSAWRVREPQAERVRLAFRMAAAGARYRDIRDALNGMESEAGTGERWTPYRVRAMLGSEVYAGDLLTNQWFTADYLTQRAARNRGDRPQYYLEGHHEAIIDRETFQAVSERLRQGARVRR